jgi:hypothetical protein
MVVEDTSSRVVGALLSRRPLLIVLARFDARKDFFAGTHIVFPKKLAGVDRNRLQLKFRELAVDDGKLELVRKTADEVFNRLQKLSHQHFYTINYKTKQKLVVFKKVCYYKIALKKL